MSAGGSDGPQPCPDTPILGATGYPKVDSTQPQRCIFRPPRAALFKRRSQAIHSADKFVVDDAALARYFNELGRDRKPGRQSDRERIIAVPIGMAICDVALAHVASRRAVEWGVGRLFSLT